ncbi:hypothetical protein G7046_g5378 [Stylonectria norvegica]|nr:hypothetical protein G7046_g5378 [Stylonectria norvegica]
MAPARQQPAPSPFSKDEKVLCFHMDMLYEAKIMDVQPKEKPAEGYRYKIHYKGWKNTWDDWVLVDRIRPFDDEHKELAAQLQAQVKHNMQKNSKMPKKGLRSGADSARVSEERGGSATVQGGRGGGRRGKDWELEQPWPHYQVIPRYRLSSSYCFILYDIIFELSTETTFSMAFFATGEPGLVALAAAAFFVEGKSAPGHAMDTLEEAASVLHKVSRPETTLLDIVVEVASMMDKVSIPANTALDTVASAASVYSNASVPENAAFAIFTEAADATDATDTGGIAYMPFDGPYLQHFPTSNVRGAFEEEQPLELWGSPTPSTESINIKKLRLRSDNLKKRPREVEFYLKQCLKKQPQERVAKRRKKTPVRKKAAKKSAKKPQDGEKPISAKKSKAIEKPKAEDAFHNKPMIALTIPDHVQAMLVDDWENITKNNQLVPLPHLTPVTKILEDYLVHERRTREADSASMDILEEVMSGFREYFEKTLSRILLYRFERHQYQDLKKLWENADENSKIKSISDCYGAEHLARLIVSLPELLAQTNMDQQSVTRLREEIGKFTGWLGRNAETYFYSEYETPPQSYVDKARAF